MRRCYSESTRASRRSRASTTPRYASRITPRTRSSLYARRVEAEPTTASHMAVHSLDPQTLAIALNDSPAGLLAWIVERRRAWSDCGGEVERAFSREHLLTTASLYWLTETIGSSLRFYWETARQNWQPSHSRRPTIEAPTAMAVLPRDVFPLPAQARRAAREPAALARLSERWAFRAGGSARRLRRRRADILQALPGLAGRSLSSRAQFAR